MSEYIISMAVVVLLGFAIATPAAAHGFLMMNTGTSLPEGVGLLDLNDNTSFFFAAVHESGTGIDNSEIVAGLRFYARPAGFRPYWGLYGLSESLNNPITYSRHGLEDVYGCEWRYGEVFQVCAFAEAGVCLAKENGEFVCEPVYGLGIGVSLWMY